MYNEDQSLHNFTIYKSQLESFLGQGLNEADTRLKIIDTIFINILGWEKKDLTCELPVGQNKEQPKHNTLYADYVLESNNSKYLVEAKREGRYFELPNSSNRRTYIRKGVIRKGGNNGAFLDQGIKYMDNLGTPFCVLCNGPEFIIIRKKIIHSKKDIVIFRSFEDIENNFIAFWNILSPLTNGVEYLDQLLEKEDEIRQPPIYSKRILDSLYDKNNQISENAIEIAVGDYLRKFFGELTNDSQLKLLEECYCDPSGRFSSFSQGLKNQVLPKPLSSIAQLTKKDQFGDFGNFHDKYLEGLNEEEGSVFVLLGGVGAGKSTFIKHFYNFELEEANRNNIIWISIDFLNFTESLEKIGEFVIESISEKLYHEYKSLTLDEWNTLKEIYNLEAETIVKGLPPHLKQNSDRSDEELYKLINKTREGKKELHLQKVLRYIKENLDRNICFIFDNTDQKTYEEQKEILMHAFQKASIFKSTIITALRLENYFSIKNKPPFDAYQPIEFRIEAPKVKELLKKRIEASKKYPKHHFNIDYKEKTLKIPVQKFIKVLENTLDLKQDNSVEELFESLSEGNMRRALQLFKRFIRSGNSKIYEIVDSVSRIENACATFEYVFDGVIRGDNKYYNSKDSDVKNLFYYYDDGFYSHFTAIYLLKFIEQKSLSKLNEGYVEINELLDKFSSIFVSQEMLYNVLEPLLQNFLINSDIGARSNLFKSKAVTISNLGKYYINFLIKDVRYYQHIIHDTPITDRKTYEKLNRLARKVNNTLQRISKKRLTMESIEIFLDYLKECEEKDLKFLKDKQFPIGPIMDEIKNDVKQSKLEEFFMERQISKNNKML